MRLRPGFARDLAARARVDGLALSETIEFAFRARYRLPPTDPRFLDATAEMMLVDHWAWAHYQDPKLRHELVVADGFDDDVAEMERASLAREAELDARIAAVPPDDWEEI